MWKAISHMSLVLLIFVGLQLSIATISSANSLEETFAILITGDTQSAYGGNEQCTDLATREICWRSQLIVADRDKCEVELNVDKRFIPFSNLHGYTVVQFSRVEQKYLFGSVPPDSETFVKGHSNWYFSFRGEQPVYWERVTSYATCVDSKRKYLGCFRSGCDAGVSEADCAEEATGPGQWFNSFSLPVDPQSATEALAADDDYHNYCRGTKESRAEFAKSRAESAPAPIKNPGCWGPTVLYKPCAKFCDSTCSTCKKLPGAKCPDMTPDSPTRMACEIGAQCWLPHGTARLYQCSAANCSVEEFDRPAYVFFDLDKFEQARFLDAQIAKIILYDQQYPMEDCLNQWWSFGAAESLSEITTVFAADEDAPMRVLMQKFIEGKCKN